MGLGVFAERNVALRRPDGTARPARYRPSPGGDSQGDAVGMARLNKYWHQRLTYPTGRFDPAWVRAAAVQHAQMLTGVPAGVPARLNPQSPLALATTSFTALGPQPARMTGQVGGYDWTTAVGRVNDIAVDPSTTVNGSIVAYLGAVGGGVWKTSNCCTASTTWTVVTDDPLISTTAINTIVIDPNNHNTIYAGTGDLRFAAFSMGSQGILKSTNAGATWRVLGADVFGMAYSRDFAEYDAVGKVRVDPNNSNKVVAGTKRGLYFSYDAGVNWAGPCRTNNFSRERQDVTGLELSNMGGGNTRIIAAIGDPRFFVVPDDPEKPLEYLQQPTPTPSPAPRPGANGANGIYKATMGSSGCPGFTSIATNTNGFVFGNEVIGSPYATGARMNAGSGRRFVNTTIGNQLGRIDIAVAPSNANYIYAQVQSIAENDNGGCGNKTGCQLGAWATTNGGTSWSYMEGSQGGALRDCANHAGDYPQNSWDQGVAVDPKNPNRVFFDTFDVWFATRTGTSWNDVTCGFSYVDLDPPWDAGPVHVDQQVLAFVPRSSSILLLGNDGGVHGTINANTINQNTRPPPSAWFNMYTGLNTIEFYSGDISGNFANAAVPEANGGTQDNGACSVTFRGHPTGPTEWQVGNNGDGYYARIDPVGTGSSLRFWQGVGGGALLRCVKECTGPRAPWGNNVAGSSVICTPTPTPTSTPPTPTPTPTATPPTPTPTPTVTPGNWSGDDQSALLPYDLFHGGIPGGDDCQPAGVPGGCGHLIAGTTRVWETIRGGNATFSSSDWYVTNNPICQNMTKGDGVINQVKYSPKYQSVAMVGTNDGKVWIGFDLGTGTQSQATWVDVTGENTPTPTPTATPTPRVLPNRAILGIALDPSVSDRSMPVGYAAVGGFNPNTPDTPGHVFQVTCAANCGSFTWADKTGNLPDIPVDSIIVNPNMRQQVFAGTDWGVYYTNDITLPSPTWQRFESGIPHAMVWDMQIDRGSTTLSVWTRSRGAYAYPLPGSASPTPTPTPTASPTPIPPRPTPTVEPRPTPPPRP